MLTWPPGGRDTDGVWAPHWYGSVETSTGFEPYHARTAELPARLNEVYERCLEPYRVLYDQRLQA